MKGFGQNLCTLIFERHKLLSQRLHSLDLRLGGTVTLKGRTTTRRGSRIRKASFQYLPAVSETKITAAAASSRSEPGSSCHPPRPHPHSKLQFQGRWLVTFHVGLLQRTPLKQPPPHELENHSLDSVMFHLLLGNLYNTSVFLYPLKSMSFFFYLYVENAKWHAQESSRALDQYLGKG